MSDFPASKYFDLADFEFGELFENTKNSWEVFPRLEEFIISQFSSGRIKANYKDKKDVFIGEETHIQNGAEITGPAIIGRNCIITHASLLRGACLIGDNARVGHAAEVKDSIFLNGAIAAHLNYVGDSILGNNVNISGGAILANFRLDKKPVFVRNGNKKIETNLQKFGSIIGDGSNIGVNAVLNPGTILGKNTIVYPLLSVSGLHPENEIIKL